MDTEFTFPEKEVLKKIARFCSYRDRSTGEVIEKLKSYGFGGEKAMPFIDFLKKENFVDDKRFAGNYVRGKLNNNHWGRLKIKAGLIGKNIEKHLIDKAIGEIDDKEYKRVLQKVLQRKIAELSSETDEYKKKQKLIRYALSKGFTYDEINDQIKKIW